jgi:hypothetical protein
MGIHNRCTKLSRETCLHWWQFGERTRPDFHRMRYTEIRDTDP